ncbi:MAG: hypothetical protein JSR58_06610 [Verrucomicrobia bacterium]|nr:hypothetical protein [Verrucomicrobiota bacterium]
MIHFPSPAATPKKHHTIQITPTVGDLCSRIYHLIPRLKGNVEHSAVRLTLEDKARTLATRHDLEVLSREDTDFYLNVRLLFDEKNKVDPSIANQLINPRVPPSTPQNLIFKRPAEQTPQVEGSVKKQKLETPQSTPLAQKVASTPLRPPATTTDKTKDPTMTFGSSCYEKHLGKVGQALPIPDNLITLMQEPCPFYPDKIIYQTHIFRLIVPEINGKPYTLANLNDFFKKTSHPTKMSHIEADALMKYGNEAPAKPYWIMVTREPIPESLNKTREEQEALLAKYPNYRMGTILELSTSFLTQYVECQERLNADTYSRTLEPGLTLGCFSVSGLFLGEYDDNTRQIKVGINAVRQIS